MVEKMANDTPAKESRAAEDGDELRAPLNGYRRNYQALRCSEAEFSEQCRPGADSILSPAALVSGFLGNR